MNSSAKLKYNNEIHHLPAEKRNGHHISTIGGLAGIFGKTKVPIRAALELAGKSVDWDGDENTILVTVGDKYPGNVTKAEFESLCRITQAEAGGEDIKGRILVVNVIINRVRSERFSQANTIKEVIFAPNQFEPTRNGAYKRAIPSQQTREAVQRALNGEDYSQGALFFRSTRGLQGSWHQTALSHLFTHGGHAFFNHR